MSFRIRIEQISDVTLSDDIADEVREVAKKQNLSIDAICERLIKVGLIGMKVPLYYYDEEKQRYVEVDIFPERK